MGPQLTAPLGSLPGAARTPGVALHVPQPPSILQQAFNRVPAVRLWNSATPVVKPYLNQASDLYSGIKPVVGAYLGQW